MNVGKHYVLNKMKCFYKQYEFSPNYYDMNFHLLFSELQKMLAAGT